MFMLSVDIVDPVISDAICCIYFCCTCMSCYDTGYFHFKLNLIINQLEYIVDRVMVPLNRVFPVQPHLSLWEGLYSVRCHAFGQCLQRGKVMGVRYPGPVSRHNLVCLFVFMVPCPRLGPFMFCHDGGRWCLW